MMDAYAGEEEGEEGGEKLRIIDGFRLYPRRWLMLALFSLLSLTNALAWISFAPISYHTGTLLPPLPPSTVFARWPRGRTSSRTVVCRGCAAEFYRIREHWVSGLAMVYMLAYIGGVWVGAWVIEKNGLRFGVRVVPPPPICVCARVTHLGGNRWWPAAS